MLNPKFLRTNLTNISDKLATRGIVLEVNEFYKLEEKRKYLQIETEKLQSKKKYLSNKLNILQVNKKNIEEIYIKINKINENLSIFKTELLNIKNKIYEFILNLPNVPDDSIPKGIDKNNNLEIIKWGKPYKFNFIPKDHVALGKINNALDFKSATKITGSRFVVMKNQIAKLHRALSQFMLDLHTEEHGYHEIYVPYLVNYKSLYGSGQLPKFSTDLFHIKFFDKKETSNNFALIPTSEVSLINLFRNTILTANNFPIKLTAYSPCFRSEAGSYGRDTRGLIRMHQFDKVELVQVVEPDRSMDALEELTGHAEKVLQLLELPYRKIILCTGDLGFSAAKTYDLEVWFPGQNKYIEISSCSNTTDFQSRRIQARFRSNNNKMSLVHMLNGSGLAVGRTLAAIMENYQKENGNITIPKVLQPYMNWIKYIR